MASRIVPPSGEVVEATVRQKISNHRRDLVLERQSRICPMCEKPLPSTEMPSGVEGVPGWTMTGPFELDHQIPIELGGSNDVENLQALCVPCHKAKTRSDIKAIAKARRLRKKADPAQRKAPSMVSRGFDKSKSRKMNGEVVTK